MLPKLVLILGGAASGKSAYAESLVLAGSRAPVYLASAQAFDDEMRAKIDTHIARRGPGWHTVEAPMNAANILDTLEESQCCLFDCATMWLSNHMLADSDLDAAQAELDVAIAACRAQLVIVTNEVGQSIVPENALARRFRERQGRLNIALAARADCVVQVIAGIPRILKGELP